MMMLIDDCDTESLCLCMCGHASLQAEGQEVASVVSTQEIRVVAELLQVSPDGLQKSVTFKMTVSRTTLHKQSSPTTSHTYYTIKTNMCYDVIIITELLLDKRYV